jgi:endo-1,4-beta-D-glucanase Y
MSVFLVFLFLCLASAIDLRGYTYGTTFSSTTMSSTYSTWYNAYVTSSGCPTGGLRVKRASGDSYDTVSEGIGYGMLIAAYMGDQTTFNGLWTYAKYFKNANGLMNWQISSYGTVLQTGAATDADEDMAMALIVADKKWGGYTTDATSLINAIYTYEVESGTYVVKPGDQWGGSSCLNISYLAPAYYTAFATYTNNTAWNSVASKSYTIINAAKNSSTYLVPDWCTSSGGSSSTPTWDTYKDAYSYDACRTPMRISVDYFWNGNSSAYTYCNGLASFFAGKGVDYIVDGYYLNGTAYGSYKNASFVGPAACAVAVSSQSSTTKTAFYNKLVSMGQDSYYYSDTLRMVDLLILTGYFYNPLTTSTSSSTTTTTTTTTTSTIALKASINSLYVSIDNSSGGPLVANRSSVNTWEEFTLVSNTDGTVSLKNIYNGLYVSINNTSGGPLMANRSSISTWEKFYKIANSDGTISLKSAYNSNYVCAENWGYGSLIANRSSIGTWEKFTLEYK